MARSSREKRSSYDGFVLPMPMAADAEGRGDCTDREVRHALIERVKELNCLYKITELAEPTPRSVRRFLQTLIPVIKASYQYPDITGVRIRLDDVSAASGGYASTRWRMIAPIVLWGKESGALEVAYGEERPAEYEGPFLFEERALLNAVAARIGQTVERIRTQKELQAAYQQLQKEQAALHEANAALRVVLSRLEEEKREIRSSVQANVNKVLMPLLDEMDMDSNPRIKEYARVLRANLRDIVSPFVNELSSKVTSLTPTEIQICNHIRRGLRTKEIAAIRKVSPATIHRHRERIRQKLGIANANVNLSTFLQSALDGEVGGSGC